jgi:tRNA threonylcarbamoyl adenosine modification protein YeaZ
MTQDAVLAIDLSSPRGAVAVVRNGRLLLEATFVAERSHNASLFAPLAEALDLVGDAPARLVVGTGPGSYTGVRIAIAAAQGVALARGWPVFGLPSISTAGPASYGVLGDARRGLFYLARIDAGTLAELRLADPATARAAVEAGGEWFTYDTVAPLGLPNVRVTRPDAPALARRAAALEEDAVRAAAGRPLEPCYLQEAFITTARKPGKQVAPHA